MTQAFDPYHKWLGISPHDQPPTHYRLLGVELFESDPDVISNAADGRMAQVKNFQSGKHSELSQRILNEIAVAKVCLLNAEKKAEYDRRLREQLEPRRDTANGSVVPPPPRSAGQTSPAIEGILDFGGIAVAPHGSTVTRGRSKRKKQAFPWPLVGVIGSAVFVLAGLVVYFTMAGNGANVARGKPLAEEKPSGGAPTDNTSKTAAETSALKTVADSGKTTTASAVKTVPRAEDDASSKTIDQLLGQPHSADQVPEKPSPIFPDDAAKTVEDPAEKTDEPGTKPELAEKPTEPPGPKKLPVPDDEKQQAAEARVREIFQKEFTAAKTSEAKAALAKKLVEQGTAADDNPVERFVLWRLGGELAAAAGEIAVAIGVVNRIDDTYGIDALDMKVELLSLAADALRSGPAGLPHAQQIVEAAKELGDEAVSDDDFDTAARVAKVAEVAARKSSDKQLRADVTAHARELNRLKTKYAAVKKAIDRLAQDPADAEANLAVGRWYCFDKGEWDRGLPLLVKGASPDLAAVAKRDLARPSDPKPQTAIADAWWGLADKAPSSMKLGAQTRAVYWYEQAVSRLVGLEKKRVEDHLAMVKTLREVAPKPGGFVEAGNVALVTNGAKFQSNRSVANPETLLDGDTSLVHGRGYATSDYPCEWLFSLNKPYRLRQVRFRLYDVDPRRYYNYVLAVSADGHVFKTVQDASKGEWRSWQSVDLPAQTVRVIKIIGLHCSESGGFHVAELEAYCIVPDAKLRK